MLRGCWHYTYLGRVALQALLPYANPSIRPTGADVRQAIGLRRQSDGCTFKINSRQTKSEVEQAFDSAGRLQETALQSLIAQHLFH